MPAWWSAPPLWCGETCFILGGGPSLKGFDAEVLRGRGRVLAINDAGLVMAPWADCLFFADKQWLDGKGDWQGNWRDLPLYTGPDGGERLIVSRAADLERAGDHDIKRMAFARHQVLACDPCWLAGRSGGANAINLAVHFGAARQVLLGFDMRPSGNWHDRHGQPQKASRYPEAFVPELYAMAPVLQGLGVEILNATPGSALTCFPMVDLEAVLRCLPSRAASTAAS